MIDSCEGMDMVRLSRLFVLGMAFFVACGGLSALDEKALYPAVSGKVVYLRHEFTLDPAKAAQATLWNRFEDAIEARFLAKPFVVSSGSGFVVDDRGRIITNRHVADIGSVDGLRRMAVRLVSDRIDGMTLQFSADERKRMKEDLKALFGAATYRFGVISGKTDLGAVKVLAKSGEKEPDLALVEISPFTEWPLTLLESNEADRDIVGSDVFSFGYPLGDKMDDIFKERVVTMNKGMVSAARPSELMDVQHSAAISPGNSGGPLVDPRGRVVGVNTASVDTDKGSNLFYAIGIAKVGEFLVKAGYGSILTWNRRLAAMEAVVDTGLRKNQAGEFECPSVVVLSVPQDVAVTLNGKALGFGPQALMLAEGSNVLDLASEGKLTSITLRSAPSMSGPVTFTPVSRRRLAAMELESDPPGAEAFADGKALGITPCIAELPPDSYRISFNLRSYVFPDKKVKLEFAAKATVRSRGEMAYRVALKAPVPIEDVRAIFKAGGETWSFDKIDEIALPRGGYALSIDGVSGLDGVSVPVEVDAGPTEIDLGKYFKKSTLEVRGLIPGTRIFVNGIELPPEPGNPLDLPLGVNTVGVWKEGFRPLLPTRITVREDGKSFVTWKRLSGNDAKRDGFLWSGVGMGAAGAIAAGLGWGLGLNSVILPQVGTFEEYRSWKTAADASVVVGACLLSGAMASEICAWLFNRSHIAEKKEFFE
jgi:S1-C subfamily serine protease